eukprot:TRINITY_DN22546_c0_g1_i1.p1 TRINITY_DN22546_c0_g1~~TRINITY_DN22546_c0_g1_i1.p1  ORF type:complete len:451 (+),score=138.71 TRINITY_DN22546_c0_g1_i1:92-1444(+)
MAYRPQPRGDGPPPTEAEQEWRRQLVYQHAEEVSEEHILDERGRQHAELAEQCRDVLEAQQLMEGMIQEQGGRLDEAEGNIAEAQESTRSAAQHIASGVKSRHGMIAMVTGGLLLGAVTGGVGALAVAGIGGAALAGGAAGGAALGGALGSQMSSVTKRRLRQIASELDDPVDAAPARPAGAGGDGEAGPPRSEGGDGRGPPSTRIGELIAEKDELQMRHATMMEREEAVPQALKDRLVEIDKMVLNIQRREARNRTPPRSDSDSDCEGLTAAERSRRRNARELRRGIGYISQTQESGGRTAADHRRQREQEHRMDRRLDGTDHNCRVASELLNYGERGHVSAAVHASLANGRPSNRPTPAAAPRRPAPASTWQRGGGRRHADSAAAEDGDEQDRLEAQMLHGVTQVRQQQEAFRDELRDEAGQLDSLVQHTERTAAEIRRQRVRVAGIS